jgi:hypothetical protein
MAWKRGSSRGVALGADVGDRRGIFADEDEGEAGGDTSLGELGSALGYLSADLLGDGAAVDDLGGHGGDMITHRRGRCLR